MIERNYSNQYYLIRLEETKRLHKDNMYLISILTELSPNNYFLEHAQFVKGEKEAFYLFRSFAQKLDKAFENSEEPTDLFINLIDELNTFQITAIGACLADIL